MAEGLPNKVALGRKRPGGPVFWWGGVGAPARRAWGGSVRRAGLLCSVAPGHDLGPARSSGATATYSGLGGGRWPESPNHCDRYGFISGPCGGTGCAGRVWAGENDCDQEPQRPSAQGLPLLGSGDLSPGPEFSQGWGSARSGGSSGAGAWPGCSS